MSGRLVRRVAGRATAVAVAGGLTLASFAGSCGPTDAKSVEATYSGSVNGAGTQVNTSSGGTGTVTCTYAMGFSGIYTIHLPASAAGMYSGTTAGTSTLTGNVNAGAPTVLSTGGSTGTCPTLESTPNVWVPPVTGSASSLSATASHLDPSGVVTMLTFTGSLNGGVITGTVTLTNSGHPPGGGNLNSVGGTLTVPVTLSP